MRALQAGGMGVPFLPVRGILGSAYLAVNPRFRVMADPFSGEELTGKVWGTIVADHWAMQEGEVVG